MGIISILWAVKPGMKLTFYSIKLFPEFVVFLSISFGTSGIINPLPNQFLYF